MSKGENAKTQIDLDEIDTVIEELRDVGFDCPVCTDHPILKGDGRALETDTLALWLETLKRLREERDRYREALEGIANAGTKESMYRCPAIAEDVLEAADE